MTLPPPPSTPYGGPHGGGIGGSPQWGSQQPDSAGGQFGGPPPWGPPPGQPQWGGPPAGPPPKGGKGKWILGGIIVALVVALAVTITVLVVRPESGGPSATPTDGADSEFASADDTGPVNIITEDPTCKAWNTIAREYARTSESVNWADRDQSIPSTAWTPVQRTMYETVKAALDKAADQTVSLIPLTPHRVMRELYEQFVAYARAFSDRIPGYVGDDRFLASTADGLTSSAAAICSSIDYESAQRLAPLVSDVEPPTRLSSAADGENPQPSLRAADAVCTRWADVLAQSDDDTKTWRELDPSIPATAWTPEQRSINEKVATTMGGYADQYEEVARSSENPLFEDFGVLAAQYQRAFVLAIPTYTSSDNFLTNAATFLAATLKSGCKVNKS
ncbi:hypothetical protein ACN27E_05640 [Mycobacterium sp. WMMD1722]|uniref:hypothetical protein n=1 Tax=Mycobacterium sp. WMMD1722 TaxID=3404117 RepID=UPI003BF61AF9